MLDTTKEKIDSQEPLEPHKPARPMMVVMDDKGERWLCDSDRSINPKSDLSKQGCWNCGELAFTRND